MTVDIREDRILNSIHNVILYKKQNCICAPCMFLSVLVKYHNTVQYIWTNNWVWRAASSSEESRSINNYCTVTTRFSSEETKHPSISPERMKHHHPFFFPGRDESTSRKLSGTNEARPPSRFGEEMKPRSLAFSGRNEALIKRVLRKNRSTAHSSPEESKHARTRFRNGWSYCTTTRYFSEESKHRASGSIEARIIIIWTLMISAPEEIEALIVPFFLPEGSKHSQLSLATLFFFGSIQAPNKTYALFSGRDEARGIFFRKNRSAPKRLNASFSGRDEARDIFGRIEAPKKLLCPFVLFRKLPTTNSLIFIDCRHSSDMDIECRQRIR